MITIREFAELQGQPLGVSPWMQIDQDRIDRFADVTGDHQFIHVDPARARAETDLDGTIAHGFLTLALLSRLNAAVLPDIARRRMTFNYGLNRVRFLAPVPVASRIRSHVKLLSVQRTDPGRYLCCHEARIETEHAEKPALIAEQLLLHILDD